MHITVHNCHIQDSTGWLHHSSPAEQPRVSKPQRQLKTLAVKVTGQLMDCQLTDWTSRRLVNLRTRQLVH